MAYAPTNVKHIRANSLYEKIAKRDSARAKKRWLLITATLLAAGLLVWLFRQRSQVSRLLIKAKEEKKSRVAFVVLTDPREKHEENVIPMLAHVEQKYGTLLSTPRYTQSAEAETLLSGWTGHPYFVMIDGTELPTEAVQNATRDATNGKATWILIDRSVGWGKPEHIPDEILK